MSLLKKRALKEMRAVTMHTGYLKYALGSCLISVGNTKVLCTASVEERVPPFLKGKGSGWLSAEYGMIPASCNSRIQRERGKVSGRSQEIQRLIGRSLRAVVDLEKLGERTVWIDCDVIQGDGGTRTAAITGSYVALYEAVTKLIKKGLLKKSPLIDTLAAVSVGIVSGKHCLDLEYIQDSNADVDMNFVMTGKGKFIEIQGTAEKEPFSEEDLLGLMKIARKGIRELTKKQKEVMKLLEK